MPHWHPEVPPSARTRTPTPAPAPASTTTAVTTTVSTRVRVVSALQGVKHRMAAERGSAVLEFTFLALLLLVPVVYLVLTLAQLQGASFAVVGAADQAAKVYVDAPDQRTADAAARQAVRIALEDFGFSPELSAVEITCDPQCLTPGSSVRVAVELTVPLPLIPSMPGVNTSPAVVDAQATQRVERFG